MRKKTKAIALCAIISALEFVMLYVGSVTDILDLSFCALATFISAIAVIEVGSGAPWIIYAVTSVLSALLLPNKFIAFVYILFAGFYPMAKAIFERFHYVITWLLKLSTFNTSLLLVIVICKFVLELPEMPLAFEIGTIGLANAAFVLYDICFTKLITLYIVKLRKRLKLKNYFEN